MSRYMLIMRSIPQGEPAMEATLSGLAGLAAEALKTIEDNKAVPAQFWEVAGRAVG